MPFKIKLRINRNIINCIMLIVTTGLIFSCASVNPTGLWMQGKFQETVNLFETGE